MDLFSTRVRELRRGRGLSQKQFADAVGTTQQSVTDWELGKKSPKLDSLLPCAEFFNVSLDYLTGRTDVPYIVRSCSIENGEIICFTTKKDLPADAERPDQVIADVSVDDDALPTNRKELEQFVESVLRKALSGQT